MIISHQSFPGDTEQVGLKADNDVAIFMPLPLDKGTPKATVTPPMDVAGNPDTAPKEPKEKTPPGSVTLIRTQEPQLPRKEYDRHAADRKCESQGRAGSGNFHTANSHDPDHKQENRKKHHHHPVLTKPETTANRRHQPKGEGTASLNQFKAGTARDTAETPLERAANHKDRR